MTNWAENGRAYWHLTVAMYFNSAHHFLMLARTEIDDGNDNWDDDDDGYCRCPSWVWIHYSLTSLTLPWGFYKLNMFHTNQHSTKMTMFMMTMASWDVGTLWHIIVVFSCLLVCLFFVVFLFVAQIAPSYVDDWQCSDFGRLLWHSGIGLSENSKSIESSCRS